MERREHPTHVLTAQVPIEIDAPDVMAKAIAEVLAGEYEAGFFGENLTILDIGANVGSFSLWANMRWPGSTIHAYEPHPGTFAMLRRNVGTFANIHPRNVAVFPGDEARRPFFGRFDGDGEAGLAACMTTTFGEVASDNVFAVDILHPRVLVAADIVKLDVEGAEAEILAGMDRGGIGLILLEYQNDANRRAIVDLLDDDFRLEFADAFAWDDLLDHPEYRRDLAGDHWGHMFFSSRRPNRLRKHAQPQHAWPAISHVAAAPVRYLAEA